jgi:peptidoglycan/LPS O-acetylase OafA/YrhL
MSTSTAGHSPHPWSLERGKGNNFDCLRFILAALVVYSHSFMLLLGHRAAIQSETFRRLTHGWSNGGSLAVDGFFAISGFLIVHSWLQSRSAWIFLQKRVARVYPAFIAASLVCLVVVGPLSFSPSSHVWKVVSLPVYLFDTLNLQVDNLPGAFPHNAFHEVNTSTWSMSFEFWFYLGVMFLGLLGVYRRPALLLSVLGGCLLLYGLQQELKLPFLDRGDFRGHTPIPFSGHWPKLGSFFFAGVCTYFYRRQIPVRGAPLAAAGLLLVSCFLGRGLWLTVPLCGTYLLFLFAFNSRLRFHGFARYGDLSYGVYLYAFPIQQLLVRFWKPHFNPYTLFLATLPLACSCAWVSWHWIEKPWLARKPKQSKQSPTTVPEALRVTNLLHGQQASFSQRVRSEPSLDRALQEISGPVSADLSPS